MVGGAAHALWPKNNKILKLSVLGSVYGHHFDARAPRETVGSVGIGLSLAQCNEFAV
jgi:hypothetical protein